MEKKVRSNKNSDEEYVPSDQEDEHNNGCRRSAGSGRRSATGRTADSIGPTPSSIAGGDCGSTGDDESCSTVTDGRRYGPPVRRSTRNVHRRHHYDFAMNDSDFSDAEFDEPQTDSSSDNHLRPKKRKARNNSINSNTHKKLKQTHQGESPAVNLTSQQQPQDLVEPPTSCTPNPSQLSSDSASGPVGTVATPMFPIKSECTTNVAKHGARSRSGGQREGDGSAKRPRHQSKRASAANADVGDQPVREGAGEEMDTSSDNHCWNCHKGGELLLCCECPRVFHKFCVNLTKIPVDDWICPECDALMVAESRISLPKNWREVDQATLSRMLGFLVDKLSSQPAAAMFIDPVDSDDAPEYTSVIYFPMYMKKLKANIERDMYRSPQSFLADFKWVLHNCVVYNGHQSLLSTYARYVDKLCGRELSLMRACPDCYLLRIPYFERSAANPHATESGPATDSAPYDRWWFTRLCDCVHPLVWVRLQKYPMWPAKVMAVDAETLLVTFFGDYDTTLVPMGAAQLHSEAASYRASLTNSSSGGTSSRRSGPPLPAFEAAMTELEQHLTQIRARYPEFKLPTNRTDYTQKAADACYGHLGRKKRPKVVMIEAKRGGTESTTSSIVSRQRRDSSAGDEGSCISEASGTDTTSLGVGGDLPVMAAYQAQRITDTRYKLVVAHRRDSGSVVTSATTVPVAAPTEPAAPVQPPSAPVQPPSAPVQPLSDEVKAAEQQESAPIRDGAPLPATDDSGDSLGFPSPMAVDQGALTTLPVPSVDQSTADAPSTETEQKQGKEQMLKTSTPQDEQGACEKMGAVANDSEKPKPPPSPSSQKRGSQEIDSLSSHVESRMASFEQNLLRLLFDLKSDLLEQISGNSVSVAPSHPSPAPDICREQQTPGVTITSSNHNPTRSLEQSPPPPPPSLTRGTDPLDLPLSTLLSLVRGKLDLPPVTWISTTVDRVQQQQKGTRSPGLDKTTIAAHVPGSSSGGATSEAADTQVCPVATPEQQQLLPLSGDPHQEENVVIAGLRGEVDRLDRELRRTRLLTSLTTAEMAGEMRHRQIELREMFDAELLVTVEAVGRLWEREVVQIVDSVKKRQWCSYCGREAFFYCCWNTCYCNTVCQEKHWITHMALCAQSKNGRPAGVGGPGGSSGPGGSGLTASVGMGPSSGGGARQGVGPSQQPLVTWID